VAFKSNDNFNVKFEGAGKLFGDLNSLDQCTAAYIDGYETNNQQQRLKHNSPLSKLESLKCYESDGAIYYAAINNSVARYSMENNTSLDSANGFKLKPPKKANQPHFFLGMRLEDDQGLRAQPEGLHQLRGVLFAHGIEGRESEIPQTKKHELFIPYPKSVSEKRPNRQIPSSVVQQFCLLAQQVAGQSTEADEETAAVRPSLPQGYDRPANWSLETFCNWVDGKLMYFGMDESYTTITRLSFSSIWRSPVTTTTHDIFNQSLLPWGTSKRNSLTPAEALFGVVESQDSAGQNNESSRNLAGRIRFSEARSISASVKQGANVSLKALGSPKTPSPAMYFNDGKNGYINKKAFLAGQGKPNGRKVYIHQPKNRRQNKQNWKTADPLERPWLKIECCPIEVDQTFYFHVDFNNVTAAELGLLLTSIEPDKKFCHKIGIGKSLGLGTVRLDIHGVFYIDRRTRYFSANTMSNRYQSVALAGTAWQEKNREQEFQTRYSLELSAALSADSKKSDRTAAIDKSLVDENTLKILQALGDPDFSEGQTVCFPYTSDQAAYNESEGFKWHVANKKQQSFVGQPTLDGDKVTVKNLPVHQPPR